eukprot:gene36371-biopygen3608
MAKSTGSRDPLFEDSPAFLFTDGLALPNGPAGWEINITVPGSDETQALWGPVLTSAARPTWISAMRFTSKTGELSAIYLALAWIWKRRKSVPLDVRPRYNLVSDSELCVKLFSTHSIKRVANKRLVARINVLLDQVKSDNDISISWTRYSWTPAHTAEDDSLARGNAEADKLAAIGRNCAWPGDPDPRALHRPLSFQSQVLRVAPRLTTPTTADSICPSPVSRT